MLSALGKASDFAQRLELYGLGPQERALLCSSAETVRRLLSPALDAFVLAESKMPLLRQRFTDHAETIKAMEFDHINCLLDDGFGDRYARSCTATVEKEASFGFDARVRTAAANHVLMQFSKEPAALFKNSMLKSIGAVLQQALLFDIATALTLHEQIASVKREKRNTDINAAIADFSSDFAALSVNVNTALSAVEHTAGALHDMSSDVLKRGAVILQTTTNMTEGMNSAAAATEEVSVSVSQIASLTAGNMAASQEATSNAQAGVEAMQTFLNVVSGIGAVTNTIKSIAERTNLLALNATIEAARAGSAGRGFSIVAGEVKHLAQQTTGSTNEIAAKLEAIQSTAALNLQSSQSVFERIENINLASSEIATAVSQQEATARSLANQVASASDAASHIQLEFEQLAAKLKTASELSEQLKRTFHQLQDNAQDIQTKTRAFFSRIREA